MKAIPRVFFCLCLLVAVPELAAQQRQDCCWSGSRTTPNCWASWPQSSLKMGRYDSPPSAPGVELRDAGALETAAHALRGSAANFEATQAVEAALKLELMGRDGDLTGVDEAWANLQLVMKKLNVELGALAGGRSI